MSRTSSASSSIKDHHHRLQRTRIEETDKRREAWLMQQERERQHEIRKKRMILEYELKRVAMLSSKEVSRSSSHQRRRESSRSISSSHESIRSRKKQRPSEPYVMSQKMESGNGSSPLFRGPDRRTFSLMEFRRIKVDIHRNIPGVTATYSKLQRNITSFEEITLKRRKDEGVKPIFDREELRLPERTTKEEVEEFRTVKTMESEKSEKISHSEKRRCKSLGLSASRCQNVSTSPHRTRCQSDCRDRSKGREKRHRSKDLTGHRSLHRSDNKNLIKRKSSRERFHSVEKKHGSQHNRSPQSYRADEKRYQESWGRSREQRKISQNRDKDRFKDENIPILPHYVEPVPVPVYYANLPARPIMMSPMISAGGPWNRNSLPIGPRITFPHGFMHPHIYRRLNLSSNSRFNRMF
ncbi:RNA-binding protein 25-like [Belonocnema kinseyi]|uniref:RNA-binding protein 25-like n=1 Tax=Belonocnema kinseyi TaxID=2817044 RepID=UPI00143DF757|nr:RNA-binding protein 25-like [Belonocnema kinseyi]